jgi:hypothetical protein
VREAKRMEDNRPNPDTDLKEVYVDWREESAASEEAYGRWSIASDADRALAFTAYKAALEREEQAAIVYRNHLRRNSSPG